jgi:uncharacterized protein YkwD
VNRRIEGPAEPRIRIERTGEWWRRRVDESRLEAEPETRDAPGPAITPPPPPPPPLSLPVRRVAVPAPLPARPGDADAAAVTRPRRAPSIGPVAPPGVRRPARRWRPDYAVTVAVSVFLIALGALILAPPPVNRATEPDGRRQRAAVPPAPSPAPPRSPGAQPSQPSAGGVVAGSECVSCAVPAAAPAFELIDQINDARVRAGRPALVSDADLALVAQNHVAAMVERSRLFHSSNSVLGRRVTKWSILAESIGVGPDVSSLVDAFMHSEEDRNNMLDAAFRHVGVGAVRQGRRLWVTVLFSDAADPGTTLSHPG